MEAAVEGLQDVEYLRMLRSAADSQSDAATRDSMEKLLQQAKQFALEARADDTSWSSQHDRSRAEQLRLQIGTLLDSVAR